MNTTATISLNNQIVLLIKYTPIVFLLVFFSVTISSLWFEDLPLTSIASFDFLCK
jgi:hypothetical protein